MSLLLPIRPNPFRFLLYTEWVMLTCCVSLAIIEGLENRSIPVQHVLILVLQLVNILLVEQKTRKQLSVAHERLQQYALQIEDLAAVQERNRIAREIHDSLGHALTALNVQIQTVVRLWSVDPTSAELFLAQAQRLEHQSSRKY